MFAQVTLKRALEVYTDSMAGDKSPATIDWYRKRLRSLVEHVGGDRALATVTVHELRAWRGALAARTSRYSNHPSRSEVAGGLSRFTLQSYVRACRTFFRWLEAEGMIEENPAARLEIPSLPNQPRKGIDQADALKMIEAARPSPRDFALCAFLMSTGCRVAGLVGLTIGDLDFEHGAALVREKGRGGNNKTRAVFLQGETVRALRRWLICRPDVAFDQVFLSDKRHGKPAPLTENGVYLILKRLAKRAGVTQRFSPHQWRHGFARAMLANGGNLAQVSQILGHSSVDVTVRHYGTLAVSELQSAHERFAWRVSEAEPAR